MKNYLTQLLNLSTVLVTVMIVSVGIVGAMTATIKLVKAMIG